VTTHHSTSPLIILLARLQQEGSTQTQKHCVFRPTAKRGVGSEAWTVSGNRVL
ncbi:unnamed protein product, partial [Ectocarpus sp. 13 AM-2016]